MEMEIEIALDKQDGMSCLAGLDRERELRTGVERVVDRQSMLEGRIGADW